MSTVRIHFEQVYHHWTNILDALEALHAAVPNIVPDNPKVVMGGGFHRPSGVDDWYTDVHLPDDHELYQLENAVGDLPFTMGITITQG